MLSLPPLVGALSIDFEMGQNIVSNQINCIAGLLTGIHNSGKFQSQSETVFLFLLNGLFARKIYFSTAYFIFSKIARIKNTAKNA